MSQAVARDARPRASALWYTVFPAYNTALRRREATWGILFALPWLLGLLIFVVGPMLSSLSRHCFHSIPFRAFSLSCFRVSPPRLSGVKGRFI